MTNNIGITSVGEHGVLVAGVNTPSDGNQAALTLIHLVITAQRYQVLSRNLLLKARAFRTQVPLAHSISI